MTHSDTILPARRQFVGAVDFGLWVAEAALAILAGGAKSCNHFAVDEGSLDDFRAAYNGRTTTQDPGHPLDWAMDRVRLADRILGAVEAMCGSPRTLEVWGYVRVAGLKRVEAARRAGVSKQRVTVAMRHVDRIVEEVLYKHGRLMPRWRAVHVAP